MRYSRRGLIKLLLILWGLRAGRRASAAALPPQEEKNGVLIQTRRYRADAVILLLGIPVFRRSGVGSGQASMEERTDSGGITRTLFFAAGSDPVRAHGLNRLGWIREIVRESHAIPSEMQYFGVLTSSPEETMENARKAISTPAAGRSTYSAVSGRHTPGHSRSAITHFEMPAGVSWSDKRLIDAAETSFQDKVEWRESSWPPPAAAQTPLTFLYALVGLFGQRKPPVSARYVYNEQEYLLELQIPGGQANPAQHLKRIQGKIRNLRSGALTNFTVWMDEVSGSVAPVRIEYQARAFLRLIFQAD